MKKGFTLIELLVVITVLGVLAGGVLVAINPLKRINQARDAQIKSDISQIAQASQVYFTTNQSYPLTVLVLKNSGDLKTEPTVPGTNASYSIVVAPQSCGGTTASPCTNMAIYAPLNDAPSGNVWCFRSANNTSAELASSVCQSSLEETNMFNVGNIVLNGSFETGNTNGLADSWNQSRGADSTVINTLVSPAVDGSVAQRVASAGYTETLISAPITVETNASYTVTAWVKIISQTANQGVFLRGLLCGSPVFGPEYKTVGGFTQLTMSVSTGSCSSFAVGFGGNAAAASEKVTFDVDAVQVIKN